MRNKIKLHKRDFNRVLLTDVLPYEVPFILSNEGFYSAIKSGLINKSNILNAIFSSNAINTKPLVFNIAKDSESERKLYLIHPIIQLEVVSLYKKFNNLIPHLCQRSSFSLRYPNKIALAYYAKDKDVNKNRNEKYKDEGVNISSEDSIEPKYASTFYEYKEIGFLYKFYDSYLFHRIEKKFNKLFKFDIAKCFSSISSFQLQKSLMHEYKFNEMKNYYSFETYFESIMNKAYDGNSHGIVVGPEFSRIFAEMLLQSIDINIKNKLEELEIKENVHYVIKRYVDDYFLFYNDDSVRKLIYDITLDELEKYRLYCNESKNKYYEVPFVTGVTIAKHQYKDLLIELFEYYNDINVNDKKVKGITKNINYRYFQIANKLITDIKCIIYNNGISYSSITGYYFTLTKNKIIEIDETIDDILDYPIECEKVVNFLLIVIEISFFIYSMDYRVRSTYLISQLIIIINKISDKFEQELSNRIKKKIYDESYFSIKNAINKKALRNIESLNLLIAIRDIDISYQLDIDDIKSIIGYNHEELCYFNIMTCLFYIRNKKKYISLRNEIYSKILDKFSHEYYNIYNNSELMHLLFDSIRCPYLTNSQKNKIAEKALDSIRLNYSHGDMKKFLEIVSTNNWFIDWDLDAQTSIERLLLKKELKTPYGN